jgi:APA family basic amino acid/polyamine antiporter
MNFSRTLADTYKFIILLSTLTSLLAFLFSMASYVIIGSQQKMLTPVRLAVALLAFIFSLWAVIGSGQESVFWGFVLLMAGVPFYVLMKK